MTTVAHICHRCEHCGLEFWTEHEAECPRECARCSRTFFARALRLLNQEANHYETDRPVAAILQELAVIRRELRQIQEQIEIPDWRERR